MGTRANGAVATKLSGETAWAEMGFSPASLCELDVEPCSRPEENHIVISRSDWVRKVAGESQLAHAPRRFLLTTMGLS